jgi:hypothetical protein
MLAYAIDNQPPSTIVLISGDRDFAYGLAMLRLRRYRVVLVTLSNAHPSLRAQASLCFDWISDVLEPLDPTFSHQPTSLRNGKTSSPPAHGKVGLDSIGHIPSRYPSQESYHDDDKSNNLDFTNYFPDPKGHKDNSRTPLKHNAGNYFFPPDLDQPKTVASVTSSALSNGPETARVIYCPVASSSHTYLNGASGIETPGTVTSGTSDSSEPSLAPDRSSGSTPKLASYGSATRSRFSALDTLRRSSNLPQNDVAASGVPEPVSFESALRKLRAESDLRNSSDLSQQDAYNPKPQSIPQMNDNEDNDSDAAHSDIPPPPNVNGLLSASVPPFMHMPLSSLNDTTASHVSQSSEAARSLQPSAPPFLLDKFKVLVRCLQMHRSQGRIRLLRSRVAMEIACNGTTYQKAGVWRFSQYVALAAEAGIIELGGSGLVAWIALREPWYNASLF